MVDALDAVAAAWIERLRKFRRSSFAISSADMAGDLAGAGIRPPLPVGPAPPS